MSADNGIYILKTKRTRRLEGNAWVKAPTHFVYRVAHVQAFDNFDWLKENQPYNLGAYMADVWGKSEIYPEEMAAFHAADALYQSIDYVEYGVSEIDATNMIFYGDN